MKIKAIQIDKHEVEINITFPAFSKHDCSDEHRTVYYRMVALDVDQSYLILYTIHETEDEWSFEIDRRFITAFCEPDYLFGLTSEYALTREKYFQKLAEARKHVAQFPQE